MGDVVEFSRPVVPRGSRPLWRHVLGEVLRGERLEQERILTEVAASAGVSPQYLSEIERGRKDAARIGAYMATHALTPDRVLVSPARRTQETWKCTASAFKPAPAATTIEKLYEATPHAILGIIKDAPASAHTLLVVAHNPGLHEVAISVA